MDEHRPREPQPEEQVIPRAQQMMDNPFLLLIAGVVVMVIFYTGWGLWELMSLNPSPLP